jgi:hypothetical protein
VRAQKDVMCSPHASSLRSNSRAGPSKGVQVNATWSLQASVEAPPAALALALALALRVASSRIKGEENHTGAFLDAHRVGFRIGK